MAYTDEQKKQRRDERKAEREQKSVSLHQFAIELEELTKRHGFYIGACGCCGSPFVMREGKPIADDLRWHEKKQEYSYRIWT